MAEQNKKSTFRAFASQAKNDNFTTRGFSPLIERVLAGVGTKKFCLSCCPEKLHCPVPLETLFGALYMYISDMNAKFIT